MTKIHLWLLFLRNFASLGQSLDPAIANILKLANFYDLYVYFLNFTIGMKIVPTWWGYDSGD